jgi:tetratricopeptide (TPR) repeat protein
VSKNIHKIVNLLSKNQLAKAKMECEKALKKDNHNISIMNLLGVCYFKMGRFDECLTILNQAHKLSPNNAEVLNSLSQVVQKTDIDKAKKLQEKAVQLKPNATHLVNLAKLLDLNGEPSQAVLLCKQAIYLPQTITEAPIVLAQLLVKCYRFEEALSVIDEFAIKNVESLFIAITAQLSLGEFDKAKALIDSVNDINILTREQLVQYINFERSIGRVENIPTLAKVYKGKDKYIHFVLLLLVEHITAKQMEAVEKYSHTINNIQDKRYFYQKIADYYKKTDRKTWLDWLNRTNKLALEISPYNEEKTLTLFEESTNQLSRLSVHASSCSSNKPIFIFGMPRSGTTLVETILAAHSECFPSGESKSLQVSVNKNLGIPETRAEHETIFAYLNNLEKLTDLTVDGIAHTYLKHQQQYDVTHKHIIDKMPHNFILAPLLPKLLPNAKFILVNRNPIANLLSIYEQNFSIFHNYGCNLQTLVNYYKAYEKFMEKVLAMYPNNEIYQLNYEQLVSNTEEEIRSLLVYCELPFEQNCLNFKHNKRTVLTASKEQVTQGIYKNSLTPWKGLETELDVLLNAFKVDV